jgi:undecaprenyl-diphosphatase
MTLQIDKDIILWINSLVGKSAILDRIMMILANDYLVPVTISLMLMAIWFLGKTAAERDNYQRAVACAAISIGSACGLALATNHLYRHPHPFEDMPQLLGAVQHIFYPIHDPGFPSNTSAVTFAAATAIWQRSRRLGLIVFIPATLMPLAKLYAAVYYPSDILGGAILGILTAYFTYKIVMPVLREPINWAFWIFRKLCLA